MMGRKVVQPKIYYTFSLDEHVPQNHLLRVIDTYVDFDFVRQLVKPFYADGGRPSIDPVVLFRMSRLGFLYGIVSERQLAEDVRLNLAYRWFFGYDIDENPPEHTALSKARARYGPGIFEQFFRHIVKQCNDSGLIQGEELYLDASLLPANASLDSLVSRPLFHQVPGTPEQHTASLWTANDTAPDDEAPIEKRTSNERRVSRTDPDATIVVRKSDPRPFLAYKVHVAVDGDDNRLHARPIGDTIAKVHVVRCQRPVQDEQLFKLCRHAFPHLLKISNGGRLVISQQARERHVRTQHESTFGQFICLGGRVSPAPYETRPTGISPGHQEAKSKVMVMMRYYI